MNWITIQNVHFNLDQVQCFLWHKGKLLIVGMGRTAPDDFDDPDRRWYEHLCSRVSLLPVEEEAQNHEQN